MAEKRRRTNSKDAGNATVSSSKAQRDRGVSVAQDVSLKINQDEFFTKLDSLVGLGKEQAGCSVGVLVSKLEEPARSKLIEIMKNEKVNSARLFEVMLAFGIEVSSSDVLRRHRRRLLGREGCKCPRES